MSIRVIKPGILSSIQDLGRRGFRSAGVPVSGAMDKLSLRIANLLCGNEAGAPAVEITLHGAELLLEKDQLIAVCGSGSRFMIDNEPAPVNRPIFVRAFSLLSFKPSTEGCRSYLAVAGGIHAKTDLNSSSTYSPALLGGNCGRFLQSGDTLQWNRLISEKSLQLIHRLSPAAGSFTSAKWGVSPFHFYNDDPVVLRYMRGPEWDWFGESAQMIASETFITTEQYNRMGYRLGGDPILAVQKRELLSTAVCFGTVQVTHQGNLIILMADAQTTGGYPRIAQIARVDLPLCAQLRPGRQLRFKEISVQTAEELYLERERQISLLGRYIGYQ